MCVDHTIKCKCGLHAASFNFKDEIMPAEIVNSLYCPQCSEDVTFEPSSMVSDNNWIIDFDMDIARFMGQRLPAASISPERLFDEGYCTWRGVYPTDHLDSVKEREELVKLSKINQRRYLEEFKKWGIERMARLEREGWRKAREAN